jgi:hypothetical protein
MNNLSNFLSKMVNDDEMMASFTLGMLTITILWILCDGRRNQRQSSGFTFFRVQPPSPQEETMVIGIPYTEDEVDEIDLRTRHQNEI